MPCKLGYTPRILVSMAAYNGDFKDRCKMSFDRTIQWATEYGCELHQHLITNESTFGRARNMMVAKALSHADFFTHLLIIDADMGWEPWRLQRLLEWDKDMVGCPGPAKHIHWELAHEAFLEGRDPESHCLRYCVNLLGEQAKCTSGFAKVQDMGCCFFLTKIGALVKMAESYPELKCKHMGQANGKPFPDENTYMFFDSRMDTDGRYLEGDYSFQAYWRQIGGDVWADLTSNLTHVGTYHFKGNMGYRFFGRSMSKIQFDAIRTAIGADWEKHTATPPGIPDQKYHVSIVRPPRNNFPLCFADMADTLQQGLQTLGYDCTQRENYLDRSRTNIVFSFHSWWKNQRPLDVFDDYRVILYQGEQIQPGGAELPDWYYLGLRQAWAVWDYSDDNMEVINANGIESTLVPPQYHPSQEKFDYAARDKDIDVLFYGCVNQRRDFILQLLASGLRVQVLDDCYGEERDEFICRSKLVLNVHYYGAQTLERLRIAHLLANKVPVVSEQSDINPYGDGIAIVPYRQLWAKCIELLHDDEARTRLGLTGYDIYSQTSMTDILQRAVMAADHPADAVPAPVG
jgi:hypothetical protein